jgi:hypothetical protein
MTEKKFMKTGLLIFFLITLQTSLASGEFTITPLDEAIDHSKVEGLKRKDIKSSRVKYLSPHQRDEILQKHVDISKMDEDEKDLLYKSLLHYPEERLKKKWSFLTDKKIKELKNAL